MHGNGFIRSIAALRRKLRGLGAVVEDPAATAPEKATAAALKKRLEQRLREAGTPAGDWTDHAFRLGRWTKQMRRSVSPPPAGADWTEHARSFGKAARRAYKKWSSE